MGEVAEVLDGPTEDDLRAAAIDAALEDVVPPLAPNEFTREDWAARYREKFGVKPSVSNSRRILDDLVEAGELGKAERLDPRTRRRCLGYWKVEEE